MTEVKPVVVIDVLGNIDALGVPEGAPAPAKKESP